MVRNAPLVLAALALAGCAPRAARAPAAEVRLAHDVSVRRIAPGLWVHTTVGTVGGSEVPANGMLLETEGGSLLVDTGWDERQGAVLLDWAARTLGRPVRRALVTHSHRDRTGGAAAMRRAGVPVLGLAATARLAGPPAGIEAVAGLESAPAALEGAEVYFPGAGHAPDNVVVYFPRQRVLFGGCLVKADTATTVGNVADADVPGWPAVVARVGERYPATRAVVPGHGAVSGPDALRVTRELVRAWGAQSPPLAGLEVADSLAGAEFARDSIGSLTVGVVARGALVWTRSFGWADMEARRPAGRGTVYRIGSVTKPFTAVMLLQLAEAGRVRLSDPVERWYPELRRVPGLPPGAAPPTLLQLATMTSGLAAEPAQPGPFWSGPVSGWEAALAAALPRARYESFPGTAFAYSNVGYAVLGAALGRAAGQPYTRWQRERILEPLGMRRSGFEPDSGMLRELARGYVVERDGTRDSLTSVAELREGRGYKVPTGGLFTTVDDLARFLAFELGHGPAGVLRPARLDSAFGGFVATSRGLRTGYGLGFMVRRRGDFTWVGHEGGVAGYMAAMYFDRRSGIGVVALQSSIGGKADAVEMASLLLERLVAAQPPAAPVR